MDGVGNHPNAWFNSSVQYWKKIDEGKNEKGKGGIKEGNVVSPMVNNKMGSSLKINE